jgi:AT-rich interactive domain-containing protein 2
MIAASRPLEYTCEWNSCKKTFARPSQVFKHVYDYHILFDKLPLTTMMSCEWGGRDGLGPGCHSKRPKLSLLSHLQDFHCNPNILHQNAIRNQQLGKAGATSVTLPQPPPAHPGYAQNAAFLAIQRHAIGYVEPLKAPPITPTTPITVSIRLTAALVLRNLAEHSLNFKNSLHSHETYLSEICVGEGREESRTIAQCLHIILEQKSRRS